MSGKTLAQFDNTRAALVFALNASQVVPPGSAMNRMLAAVAVSDEPPKRKKRKGIAWLIPAAGSAEELLAEERERRRNPKKRDQGNRPPPLAAKDRAHQAGIILYHFSKLDPEHRLVLTGLLTVAHVPCDCRRPCCAGWSVVGQWRTAVVETCVLLKQRAELEQAPGRKGLSTQPILRQMLVEEFYLRRGVPLVDMARRAEVTTVTAARHRDWIYTYLDKVETEAWAQVAALFDVYGITGAWNAL